MTPLAAAVSADAQKISAASPGYWQGVARRLVKSPVNLGAMGVLGAIVLAAIFAPLVAPYDPYEGNIMNRLADIGAEGHLLGTDSTGRDIFSRLIWGGRLSLITGLVPVVLATLIGGTLGLIAGMGSRGVNTAIMRLMDVLFAFPSILLAVAIAGVLGSGLGNMLLSLTIVFIPQVVRVTESAVVQVNRQDYVDAARATGASTGLILITQILPNVLGPILVFATSLVAVSMVVAAGLSFIGLGIAPPAAEWGGMLNELRDALYINPMLSILPGVMIVITSICFNLFSDGLRKSMNIREQH